MIVYEKIKRPEIEQDISPVLLSDETMKQRRDTILSKMKEEKLDAIVIYADLEHGGNFEYLVGFLPRFEEALLVLHCDGQAYLVLGNENLNKVSKARIKATAVHMPHFSLPNQPMHTTKRVADILKETKIDKAQHIGFVGWKNFTSCADDHQALYELPYYIVQAFMTLCPQAKYRNAAYLFIGEHGARTINNANEFAHYEYGASLAGNCMLEAMNLLDEGIREIDVAQKLEAAGQPHSVVTIMASGPRFENANMYPTTKKIKRGDTISMTTGYKGGLQSRGGFAIAHSCELPEGQEDYLQRVAFPYYQAVVTWLETIHIGMQGASLYNEIEKVLPQKEYGWSLNPGHLCSDEEWLSSPIYPNAKEVLQSGMLFQIDIIPSVPGYNGISCESGILLADKNLREAIQSAYPALWKRIEQRRLYMKEELGIHISQEILPTSIMLALCCPYLLDKQRALKVV